MAGINDKSVGIIVYYNFPRSIKYLLLKHKKGHWAFAKGHQDEGETEIETALRELNEEAGINDVGFISKKILLIDNYIFKNKNGEKVNKTVHYFIAKSKSKDVAIDKKEISNYRWCSINSAEKVLTYNESKKILKKANKIVTKKISVAADKI